MTPHLRYVSLTVLVATATACQREEPFDAEAAIEFAEHASRASPAPAVDPATMGFRVAFPSAPTFKPLASGGGTFAAHDGPHAEFMVGVTDYSPDRKRFLVPTPRVLFIAELERMAKGGTVLSAAPTQLGTRAAYDLVVRQKSFESHVRMVVAGMRFYKVAVLLDTSVAAEKRAEAERFLDSFALTAEAPADAPLAWQRTGDTGFSISLPSEGRSDEAAFGLETVGGDLPWPAGQCSVLRGGIGGLVAADRAEALANTEGIAAKLAPQFFALPVPALTAAPAKVAGEEVAGWTMEGEFLPRFGRGRGVVRLAVVMRDDAFYLLIGQSWPGGEAHVQRCWDSLTIDKTAHPEVPVAPSEVPVAPSEVPVAPSEVPVAPPAAPPRLKPGVDVEAPRVDGPLAARTVHDAVRRHVGELKWCFDDRRRARPELETRLTLGFVVTAAGLLDKARIVEGTLRDGTFEACVLAKMARWKFPAPRDGAEVSVTMPVSFAP